MTGDLKTNLHQHDGIMMEVYSSNVLLIILSWRHNGRSWP